MPLPPDIAEMFRMEFAQPPRPLGEPSFPQDFDPQSLTGFLREGETLGPDIDPLYFEKLPPPANTPDITFGNRFFVVLNQDGEAFADKSVALVVVATATEPTLVTTEKARTIEFIQGVARVVIHRAGQAEDAPSEYIPGEAGTSFELHEGDSYAIIRPTGQWNRDPNLVVYRDTSEPGYDMDDEVRSEVLVPELERALINVGYPKPILDILGIDFLALPSHRQRELVQAIAHYATEAGIKIADFVGPNETSES